MKTLSEPFDQAQGERIKVQPFVVRLSNHERQTLCSCYSSLAVQPVDIAALVELADEARVVEIFRPVNAHLAIVVDLHHGLDALDRRIGLGRQRDGVGARTKLASVQRAVVASKR